MKVKVLNEYGYEEAVLGFSLSYNTNIDRVKQILPKYAFGVPGEGKFLESMIIYLDVTAPRFWWQEADTYRVGTTKQSESTMHTLSKRYLTNEDFEYPLTDQYLNAINQIVDLFKNKTVGIAEFKSILPEGFLQRRIWMISYKTLQGIYVQRYNHRLPQWRYFLDTVISEIQHPEFIVRPTE
jgi:hypothetical protein